MRYTQLITYLFIFFCLFKDLRVEAKNADQPNIILIMADDVSWNCFGTYGAEDYKTPHIDALASKGMKFEHCYSMPICTPSRVKIMTGQYNFRNYTHFGYLNPKDKTFGNLMQEAGYKTAIAGKWQLNGLYHEAEGCNDKKRPFKAGFDEFCLWQVTTGKTGKNGGERFWSPPLLQNGKFLTIEDNKGKYGPDIMSDFVCNFIEKNREKPFFVYYPTVLVHSPFVPTPETIGNGSRMQEANQTPKDKIQKKANYVAMVHYLDKIIGKIIQKVEDIGQLKNTIILFTSDNGTASITSRWNGKNITGAKGKTVDMGTHVPLVAYWKGHTPVGAVSNDLIDFTDFYTTFAEVSSSTVSANDPIDGRSFLPQLKNIEATARNWTFCNYQPYIGNKKGVQFVRDQTYKLYNDGRLYNIPNDIHEKENLHLRSDNKEVLKAKKKLKKIFDIAPPAPPIKGGMNASERPLYPNWRNIVNPND